MKSITTRMSLTLVGVAAAAVLAAPAAQADYPRGACLVVENNRSKAVEITVKNRPYSGKKWTIDKFTHSVLTMNGKKITNPDTGWLINAPQGEWRYESGKYAGQGCNGTWIFRLA
ncbi:hypothetical protein [Nocardia sp. NPDC050406]|uniref:hypothetical protein n=1 Tax=Nocardia sp. NPDC050406 TaxID=3364318 RepID=UPI00379F6E69